MINFRLFTISKILAHGFIDYKIIFIIIFLIANINSLYAQWSNIPIGLPKGKRVYSLATDNKIIFAGIEKNGIYQSTNDGSAWEKLENDFSKETVYAILCFNSLVFAGGETNLYVSNDNGSSWNESNNGLPKNFQVKKISAYKNYLYVYCSYSMSSNGLFYSSNNGKSWHESESPSWLTDDINSFIFLNDNIYIAIGWQGGIYYTNYTLKEKFNELKYEGLPWGLHQMTSLYFFNNNLFAQELFGNLYSYSFSSYKWSKTGNGIPSNVINLFSFKNSLVAIVKNRGFYISNTGNNDWEPMNDNLKELDFLTAIEYQSFILAGSEQMGVFIYN